MKPRHSLALLCWATAMVANGASLAADPPPPSSAIYGMVDEESKELVRQWHDLFWTRIETGETHPDAGSFSFPHPLNSPLFNPLRAGFSTVARLRLAHDEQPGSISETEREFMLHGRLATDAHANPLGTAEHARLIAEAPPGGLTVTIEGANLVTWGIEPIAVEGALLDAQPAVELSPFTLNAIAALAEAGPGFAQASTAGAEEWRKLLTGEQSRADNFRWAVEMLMFDWPIDVIFVEPIDAIFGVYGSLPLTLVSFTDAYVLMDPFNGNLAGPFAPGSPLDARSLLQSHSDAYVPGTPVKYLDMWGQSTISPEPQPGGPQPAPAQLRIRCKRITNIPLGPASHCWIEYVPPGGDNNNPDVCGGHPAWPTFEPDPQIENFPWGPIVPYCGPWEGSPEKNFPDDPNDPFGGVRTTPIRCPPGTDLQAVYDCIRDAMARIAACRVPYDPIRGPNSNTTIRAALSHCAAGCTWNGGRGRPRATHPPVGWDSDEGLRALLDCLTKVASE